MTAAAEPAPKADRVRFPAEWEPQSAVLIAWPHAGTDWAARLGAVEESYIALVAAITRFEDVVVCVADDDVQAYAMARLASSRSDTSRWTSPASDGRGSFATARPDGSVSTRNVS